MTTTHPRAGVRTYYVYEFYAEDGTCLYVGRTALIGHRIQQHSAHPQTRQSWWPEVARIEVTVCPDFDIARDAEKQRIKLLDPKHNEQFTDDFRLSSQATRKANREARHALGELCPPSMRCRFCRELQAVAS